ncbi:pentatricopeptide repeat (PPR) superfamily protein [Actinidia rufa]|uniref:Pentatricopeptide repeat (PPR) superfamily protein n=1 Tax=Actinidia rufa TaxID=165716 RepID=A0A7J0E976_9ERIC|nr:pentatricopeptide repeat (PPR) superfamily protein [Actinidia rufa]
MPYEACEDKVVRLQLTKNEHVEEDGEGTMGEVGLVKWFGVWRRIGVGGESKLLACGRWRGSRSRRKRWRESRDHSRWESMAINQLHNYSQTTWRWRRWPLVDEIDGARVAGRGGSMAGATGGEEKMMAVQAAAKTKFHPVPTQIGVFGRRLSPLAVVTVCATNPPVPSFVNDGLHPIVSKSTPIWEVTLVEKVAIFLWILGHHNKNRPTKFQFLRSEETVSRHFNAVLLAVLRLYAQLWYRPQPVLANDPDPRWRWFENCVGALDGTYVPVHPPAKDRARYRVRHRLESAAKCVGEASWVTDSKGTPTQSREEYFNMNHASARNVIERCFGVLKMRFAILRSCSYYPMRTQCHIVTACCLIHNLIKREMAVDPIELEYTASEQATVHVVPPDDYIDTIEPTTQWTEMRDNLATTMYNHWVAHGPAAE